MVGLLIISLSIASKSYQSCIIACQDLCKQADVSSYTECLNYCPCSTVPATPKCQECFVGCTGSDEFVDCVKECHCERSMSMINYDDMSMGKWVNLVLGVLVLVSSLVAYAISKCKNDKKESLVDNEI